ncbi:TetR/AcrR family transcriptional regulator [Mycobacterium sp. CVI_P3]|uniref:TetR/AcrR family transcriptional regulator n=1 Tax=Mycobacterium pinniadriaticum TaxID=2994102 RepID=A0ABT3SHD7_9MYCO|nr:TetR/AcrR family transcriptional regulator [Mycobacterium pinniadriaticum]MCX2932436.1 TetR/AcrR family transcriptional regulator [Mycobacterium pinniadriaticum]MCX2938930.1 TetR/AcrR family transcriptional regulator [Mycobacterium pinniadriaticum]
MTEPKSVQLPAAVNGRSLTRKGAQTRDRIVGAAADLMQERGVARTTIEDIQAAAGVSSSQLYHYFADKDALIAAVIELQGRRVLDVQQLGLARVTCLDDLWRWRDLVVGIRTAQNCIGGCPLGSLAADLVETDPLARAQLARWFAEWERILRDGLASMAAAGQFPAGTDTDRLALALLAATQGGLLLSQVNRDTAALTAAMDTVIAQIAAQLTEPARALVRRR